MKYTHIADEYTSEVVESIEGGCIGQELFCNGKLKARLIYWDADGQFAIEIDGELPLVVLEPFIAETKKLVPGKYS